MDSSLIVRSCKTITIGDSLLDEMLGTLNIAAFDNELVETLQDILMICLKLLWPSIVH